MSLPLNTHPKFDLRAPRNREPRYFAALRPLSLPAILFVFVGYGVAQSQSITRVNRHVNSPAAATIDGESLQAARAIELLRKLQDDVIVYRSLGDFEEQGKLARVSFETFQNHLRETSVAVEPLLDQLPGSKLRTALYNALRSFQDGGQWWQQSYRSKVIGVAELSKIEITRTDADRALLVAVPYTVAIHWRQGANYLQRAAEMLRRMPSE